MRGRMRKEMRNSKRRNGRVNKEKRKMKYVHTR
jgi:hypothetical protein